MKKLLDVKMGLMLINLFLALTGLFPVVTGGQPQKVMISGPKKVTAGVSTVYECSAVCTDSCNYSWTVNERSFLGNTFTLTADGTSNFITVACTVSDEEGKNFATEVLLVTVKNSISVKPSEDQPTINQMPKVGRSFKITCDGTTPPVTIIWLKGGELLTLNSRMSLSPDNATLSFSRLDESDGDHYQCQVLKGNASVKSKEYLINLGYVILDMSGPNQVEVGLETKFICRVKCGLDCTQQWEQPSGSPKGKLLIDGPQIRWTPSEIGQTQVFTCLAVNPAGSQLSQVSKTVTAIKAQPHQHVSNAHSAEPKVAMIFSAAVLMLVWAWA